MKSRTSSKAGGLDLGTDLVGPTKNENAAIIGETATLTVEHLGDIRPSTLLFHLPQRLLYTKWRDPRPSSANRRQGVTVPIVFSLGDSPSPRNLTSP